MEPINHCPNHDASMRLTRVLIASALCFGIVYLTWRTTTLGSGQFLLVSVPTLLVELWAFAAFFSLSAASWRRPVSRLANHLEDTEFPLVDVVVEAQSHDLEDLERTLVGLQALRGVGRIHILSDRHDVYALASTIGLHDVVRAAGDPLECVRSADSRLVLWLEAGQITMPHLLAETVTRFDEPDVAVCQVAKGLVNADSLVHLQGGRNHDALWQQAIGPSLGASGDGPWTGPGSIVRPAALQDLGSGLRPGLEGARTGLLQNGWTIQFEPDEMVREVASERLDDYLAQRQARTAALRRNVLGRAGSLVQAPGRAKLAPLLDFFNACEGLRLLTQLTIVCFVVVSGVIPFTSGTITTLMAWAAVSTLVVAGRLRIGRGAMGIGDWTREAWRTLPADVPGLFGRSPMYRALDPAGGREVTALGVLKPLAFATLAMDAALLARGWTILSPDVLPRMTTVDRVVVLIAGLAVLVPLAHVLKIVARTHQRRQTPRLLSALPIVLGANATRTIDLSPRGVGIVLGAAPAVGSYTSFELALPDLAGRTRLIRGLAVARYTNPESTGGFRVGLEFTNLSDEARLALVAYCGFGHAVEVIDRPQIAATPDQLDIDLTRGRPAVRALTGVAIVAAVLGVLAGPSASGALAEEAPVIEAVCVVSAAGEPIAGAEVLEINEAGELALGSTDPTGCLVAVADADTIGWAAEIYGHRATAGTEAAEGGRIRIVLSGRSVTVLETDGTPVAFMLRTFDGGWSDPQAAQGTARLSLEATVEALEVEYQGRRLVVTEIGDVVVVLGRLRADTPGAVVQIDTGDGWTSFVDGMQVLPGRVAARMSDGTVAKLDVVGNHEISVPSGDLRSLEVDE